MPPEHGQRLAKLLPHGQLVEVDDSYTLIPLDQPARLAQIIREFTPGGTDRFGSDWYTSFILGRARDRPEHVSRLIPHRPGKPGSKSGHDCRGRASFGCWVCDRGNCAGPWGG